MPRREGSTSLEPVLDSGGPCVPSPRRDMCLSRKESEADPSVSSFLKRERHLTPLPQATSRSASRGRSSQTHSSGYASKRELTLPLSQYNTHRQTVELPMVERDSVRAPESEVPCPVPPSVRHDQGQLGRRFYRRRSSSYASGKRKLEVSSISQTSTSSVSDGLSQCQTQTSSKPSMRARHHSLNRTVLEPSLPVSTHESVQTGASTSSTAPGDSDTLLPGSIENARLRQQLEQMQRMLCENQTELSRWREQAVFAEEKLHHLEARLEKSQAQHAPQRMSQDTVAPTPCLHFMYSSPLFVNYNGHRCVVPRLKAEAELPDIERVFSGVLAVHADVASVHSLRDALCTKDAWIYISAHTAGGMLLLEDPSTAESQGMSCQQLDRLLTACGGGAAAFVFLAACNSGAFAKILNQAGVQHVVYCASEVQDKCASRFALYLYSELAKHRSLLQAFNVAVQYADVCGDSGKYRLMGDGNLRLSTVACETAQPAAPTRTEPQRFVLRPPPIATAGCLEQSIPTATEDFVGREDVIGAVLRHLQTRHVVVLHCEASNGRTATLQEICRYVSAKGRRFAGSCAFFPGKAPPGGLLFVDDAEEVLAGAGKHELTSHLKQPGGKLLLACRNDSCYEAFATCPQKPVHVMLPPLSTGEATDLFLRTVHRPLKAADLRDEIDSEPTQVVGRKEAFQLVSKCIDVFAGDPLIVRRAGNLVRPGSPSLKGNLSMLKSKLTNSQLQGSLLTVK